METIPGGKALLYLANNIIRVDPSSKLTEEKEFGLDGFLNTVTLVKSRSNKAGKPFNLVFDQIKGFNNLLSDYNFLKTQGLIKGEKELYII